MSSQIDISNKENIEQIIRFPDKADAHLKSYSGQLRITGEGFLDRAMAFVSGSYFADSVNIIESTCSYVLMILSNNASRVLAPEDCKLIVDLQRGLGNIKKVYMQRYGRNVSIGKLETLEQRVADVRSRFLSQFETLADELEDWAVVPKDPLRVSAKVSLNPTEGRLPGMMASFFAGVKTAASLATSGISADSPRARVLNCGMQFKSADVYAFIEQLGLQLVAVVHNFYLGEKTGINILTLEQITTTLAQQTIEPGKPIIIPINFISQEVFGRNHIALIVIKDNVIEYYDAKGVFSEYRQLADQKHTLRDVLAYCQKKWTKEGKIIENSNPHQTDAHNCGMFVCKRIQEIFKFLAPLGVWDPKGPTLTQIQSFRQNIADIAYPLQEEKEIKTPSMEADNELDKLFTEETVQSPVEGSDDDEWVKA